LASAKERMLDEIGASCELEELFSFVYCNKFNDNLYEYEIDHVLLGYYDGEIVLNPEEACDYRWVSQQDLAKELCMEPKKFCSWFIICAPRVLRILKEIENA
jgi:isopentenyl-diphosphate delta-isomerase